MLEASRHESVIDRDSACRAGGVSRRDSRAGPARLPPWLVSNPIYVRPRSSDRRGAGVETLGCRPTPAACSMGATRQMAGRGRTGLSRHDACRCAVRAARERGELNFSTRLPDGPGAGQPRCARGVAMPQYLAPYDRVTFTARADRPMRISVQLRDDGPGRGRALAALRLRRRDEATHTVYFNDLTPVGGPESTRSRHACHLCDRITQPMCWISSIDTDRHARPEVLVRVLDLGTSDACRALRTGLSAIAQDRSWSLLELAATLP